MFVQNFIKLRAAVHQLSWSHRKKTQLKTILPSLPRAVKMERMQFRFSFIADLGAASQRNS